MTEIEEIHLNQKIDELEHENKRLRRELAGIIERHGEFRPKLEAVVDEKQHLERTHIKLTQRLSQRASEIEQLRAAKVSLRAELDATGETLREEIEEMQEFTDKLWKEIILRYNPDYGDWEYPGQAHRHIVAEFEQLRAAKASLERQIAAGEQADDEYAALVEKHVRDDVLCENITEAVEDAEPIPGRRKWHLYFEGLYNELPY